MVVVVGLVLVVVEVLVVGLVLVVEEVLVVGVVAGLSGSVDKDGPGGGL